MPEFRYIGLEALAAAAIGAIVEGTNEAANDLVSRAQAAAPVDTGTLRASIQTDGAQPTGTGATAKVFTGGESSGYAVFVHEGTGPHEIRAKPGGVLAFNGIFARSVHHPGTRPTKFLEGPLLQMAPQYLAHIAAAARAVF